MTLKPSASTTIVLSDIYLLLFIFPPLRIPQYLDNINNAGVKRFVLLVIALLVFLFTFRWTESGTYNGCLSIRKTLRTQVHSFEERSCKRPCENGLARTQGQRMN